MKQLRFYKPTKTNNGAATSINIRRAGKYNDLLLFIEMAQQTGVDENGFAMFGWKEASKKVSMKLGPPDIGEILCVLDGTKQHVGSKPEQGLFHKNDKGNTSFQLQYVQQEGREPSYKIRLASKNDSLVQVQHYLTLGEAKILESLLKGILFKMYLE